MMVTLLQFTIPRTASVWLKGTPLTVVITKCADLPRA